MRVKAGMIRKPTFYGRSRRYCVSYRSGNSNVNLGQKREVPHLEDLTRGHEVLVEIKATDVS